MSTFATPKKPEVYLLAIAPGYTAHATFSGTAVTCQITNLSGNACKVKLNDLDTEFTLPANFTQVLDYMHLTAVHVRNPSGGANVEVIAGVVS